MQEYLIVNTDGDYEAAKLLFREYAVAIKVDLSFQQFEKEMEGLQKMYAAPEAGIVLCKDANEFIGCIAVRKIDGSTGELKRMYVKPGNQNRGIGNGLLQKAIELARKCGYQKLRLDTLNYMFPAIRLYKQAGFYEIPAYYFNPNDTAVFFEMIL